METIDVYIYKLDLTVEHPVVEKFPAQVRDIAYSDTEVIRWVGPNDYEVWHSEFDTHMLGVVSEPFNNMVELIVKRDELDLNVTEKIRDYLDSRTIPVRKRLAALYRGYGALAEYVYTTEDTKSIGELNVSLQMIQSLNRTYVPPKE